MCQFCTGLANNGKRDLLDPNLSGFYCELATDNVICKFKQDQDVYDEEDDDGT